MDFDIILKIVTNIWAFFTLDKILAILGLIVAWMALPIWQERRHRQMLSKEFGSTFFSHDINHLTTRYYIPPNCSNVDPTREDDLDTSATFENKIFDTIDRFLSKRTTYRHMIILADSGMGKTSVLLNYYLRNQDRRQGKRYRIALVPLGIKDADEHIQNIEEKHKTILFLDAFDEDTKAIEDHKARLIQVMGFCEDFCHVILTCRTQFFPSDEEIPAETGIVRVGPRKGGEGRIYKFQKLYLIPLDDGKVKKYLRKRYPIWRWLTRRKAWQLIKKVPKLSVRPMLLTFIPDILITNPEKIQYSFELYEALIVAWINREDGWVEPKKLRQFSERLAVDLYINREQRSHERISRKELLKLAEEWQIPLEHWQITGRSLLNRDAEGNYKFAHRSIMEYLYIRADTADLEIDWQGVEPTDQMQMFVNEMVEAGQFEWLRTLSNFDLKGAKLEGADLEGADLFGADLEGAKLEGAKLEGAYLEGAYLQRANLEGADLFGADLFGADLVGADLVGADLEGADLFGANLQRANLVGADLQRANLVGADLQRAKLEGANLQEVNLQGANLERANLQEANLQGTNLQWAKYDQNTIWPENFDYKSSGAIGPGAELQGANLQGAKLQRANLQGANLEGANLQGANLERANLQGAKLQGAYLERANLQGAYLERVRYDHNTIWPNGLNSPKSSREYFAKEE